MGARQVGKTTLAKAFANDPRKGIYLDLDNSQDQAKLSNASAFFQANRHRLVVLNEIQNQPEILHKLRGEIDSDRRPGRSLILGSASFKLLKQSQSQSLAGRLALIDMAPLQLSEVYSTFADTQTLWLRGGFLLHSLLSISGVNDLLGHPSTGASWKCFVIEQIANHLPSGATLSFYRTAAGTEINAVVEMGQRKIGLEVKFSSAPTVTKGFWQACEDLHLDAAYVVAPGAKAGP
ncbi:MAG: ATP-binding protein [Chitinophagaceae bacterium]|nr:ATP-binding protein [Polaromonas sp.]